MKTISRIAYSNDKKNKTRSILIMMAICLTTMLLVIISTVGNGVIHLQKSQAAGSYGSNYGLFVSADGSQLKEVNRRAEIDATGTMCTEGIIKGNEKGGFVCMDETARKMLPYNKEYELMETSVYKGYKQDKIEMRGDRAEMSDFPLYLNTVAGGLDRRDQTIGGFSFVVKIYAVPVVEIIG